MSSDPTSTDQFQNQSVGSEVQESQSYDRQFDQSCICQHNGQLQYSVGGNLVITDAEHQKRQFLKKVPFSFVSSNRQYTLPVSSKHDNMTPLDKYPSSCLLTTTAIAAHATLPFFAVAESSQSHDFLRVCVFYMKDMPLYNAELQPYLVAVVYLPVRKPVEAGRLCSLVTHIRFSPTGLQCVGDRACTPIWAVHMQQHVVLGLQTSRQPNEGTDQWQWFHERWSHNHIDQVLIVQPTKARQLPAVCHTIDVTEIREDKHNMLVPNQSWVAVVVTEEGDVQLLIQHEQDVIIMYGSVTGDITKTNISALIGKKDTSIKNEIFKQMEQERTIPRDEVLAKQMSKLPYSQPKAEQISLCQNGLETKEGMEGVVSSAPVNQFLGAWFLSDELPNTTYYQFSVLLPSILLVTSSCAMLVRWSKVTGKQALLTPVMVADISSLSHTKHMCIHTAIVDADCFRLIGNVPDMTQDALRVLHIGKTTRTQSKVQKTIPEIKPVAPKLMVQGIEVILDDLEEPEPLPEVSQTGWTIVEAFVGPHPLLLQNLTSNDTAKTLSDLTTTLWYRFSAVLCGMQLVLAGAVLVSTTLSSRVNITAVEHASTPLQSKIILVQSSTYHREGQTHWVHGADLVVWVHPLLHCLLIQSISTHAIIAAALVPQLPSFVQMDEHAHMLYCVIKGVLVIYAQQLQAAKENALSTILVKLAELSLHEPIVSLVLVQDDQLILTETEVFIVNSTTLTRRKQLHLPFSIHTVMYLRHQNILLVAGKREVVSFSLPQYTRTSMHLKSSFQDIRDISTCSTGLFFTLQSEHKGDNVLSTCFYPFRKLDTPLLCPTVYSTCNDVLDYISIDRTKVPLVYLLDSLLPIQQVNISDPAQCASSTDATVDSYSHFRIHSTDNTVLTHLLDPSKQAEVQILIANSTPLMISLMSRQPLCANPLLSLFSSFSSSSPHVPVHDIYYPRPLCIDLVKDLSPRNEPQFTPGQKITAFQLGLMEFLALGTHTGVLLLCLPLSKHQYNPNTIPEKRGISLEDNQDHIIPHVYVLSSLTLSEFAITSINFAPKRDSNAEPMLYVTFLDGTVMCLSIEVQTPLKSSLQPNQVIKLTNQLQEQYGKPQLSSIQRYTASVASQHDPAVHYRRLYTDSQTTYAWVNSAINRDLHCGLALSPRICSYFYPLIHNLKELHVNYPLLNETKSILSMNIFSILLFIALIAFPDQFHTTPTLPTIGLKNGVGKISYYTCRQLIPSPFTHFEVDLQHILAVYLKNMFEDVSVTYYDSTKGTSVEAAQCITDLVQYHSQLQTEKQSQVDSHLFMLRYEREQKDTLVAQKTHEIRLLMLEAQAKQRKAEESAAQMRVDYDKWIQDFNTKRIEERKQQLYLYEERLAKESARVRVLSETLEATLHGIQRSFGEAEGQWNAKEAQLLQTIETQKTHIQKQNEMQKTLHDKELKEMVGVLMTEFDDMDKELTQVIETKDTMNVKLTTLHSEFDESNRLNTKRHKMRGDEQFAMKKNVQDLSEQITAHTSEKEQLSQMIKKEDVAHTRTKSLIGVLGHSQEKERDEKQAVAAALRKTNAEQTEMYEKNADQRKINVQDEVRKVVEEDDKTIMAQQKQLVRQTGALKVSDSKKVHLETMLAHQREDFILKRQPKPKAPLATMEDAVAAADAYVGEEETMYQLLAFIQNQDHVIDHFRNQVLKQKHTNNLDRSQRQLMASRAAEELRAAREQLIITRKDKKSLENQLLQMRGQSTKGGAVSRIDIMVGKEPSGMVHARPQSAMTHKSTLKPKLPREALGRMQTSTTKPRINDSPLGLPGFTTSMTNMYSSTQNTMESSMDLGNIQQPSESSNVLKPRIRPSTAQPYRIKAQKDEVALQKLHQKKQDRLQEVKQQGIIAAQLALQSGLQSRAQEELSTTVSVSKEHRKRADKIQRLSDQIQPAVDVDHSNNHTYTHPSTLQNKTSQFGSTREVGMEYEGGGNEVDE